MNPFTNPIRRIAVSSLVTNLPNVKLKRISGNMHSTVKSPQIRNTKKNGKRNGEKPEKWLKSKKMAKQMAKKFKKNG